MRILLLLLFAMSTISLSSQEELTHYYIHLKGKKTKDFTYEIGLIEYDEKFKPKRKKLEDIHTMEELNNRISIDLNRENSSDHLNVIIHGIWGDFKFEWQSMIQEISKNIYTTGDGEQKVLVSIIWDSSINYVKGIKIARRKGDYLVPLFNGLLKNADDGKKVNFICHSMGNRIFEHMVLSSGILKENKKFITHYVSVGADLQSNIFEEGQELNGIDKVIDDVTIYVHNNDRTLGMSKLINKSLRLGLHGLPNIEKSPSNFRMIDVSVISDAVDFGSGLTNHRYFYKSPTVMSDLKRILWKKDFVSSKEVLNHPNRLKLLPPEN